MKPTPRVIVPCIWAAMILIVGGIIVVKLIRFCQRFFPQNPPPPVVAPAPGSNIIVAAFIVEPNGIALPQAQAEAECDCHCPFTVQIRVGLGTNGIELTMAKPSIPALVDLATFDDSVAAWGLTPWQDSTNGTPADLSYAAGCLETGQDATIVLERTLDFQTWLPVMTNRTGLNKVLEITVPDSPCTNSALYRAQLQ